MGHGHCAGICAVWIEEGLFSTAQTSQFVSCWDRILDARFPLILADMSAEERYLSLVQPNDEVSPIDWVPCLYPGAKFHYGPDTYFEKEVRMFEVDGCFEKLDDIVYVETNIERPGTKFVVANTQSLIVSIQTSTCLYPSRAARLLCMALAMMTGFQTKPHCSMTQTSDPPRNIPAECSSDRDVAQSKRGVV